MVGTVELRVTVRKSMQNTGKTCDETAKNATNRTDKITKSA